MRSSEVAAIRFSIGSSRFDEVVNQVMCSWLGSPYWLDAGQIAPRLDSRAVGEALQRNVPMKLVESELATSIREFARLPLQGTKGLPCLADRYLLGQAVGLTLDDFSLVRDVVLQEKFTQVTYWLHTGQPVFSSMASFLAWSLSETICAPIPAHIEFGLRTRLKQIKPNGLRVRELPLGCLFPLPQSMEIRAQVVSDPLFAVALPWYPWACSLLPEISASVYPTQSRIPESLQLYNWDSEIISIESSTRLEWLKFTLGNGIASMKSEVTKPFSSIIAKSMSRLRRRLKRSNRHKGIIRIVIQLNRRWRLWRLASLGYRSNTLLSRADKKIIAKSTTVAPINEWNSVD